MLSMNDRFEINAALERLLADGTDFDPQDAALLIEKIRVSRHDFEISFQTIDHTHRDSVAGYAAGHGNIKVEDDRSQVSKGGIQPNIERVGGYKLTHRPGRLTISLMWSHTKLELDGRENEGQSALLLYDRVTKRPLQLRALANIPFEFIFWPRPRKSIQIVYGRFVPWKVPSGPGGSGRAQAISGVSRSQDQQTDHGGVDFSELQQAAT